MKKVKLKRVILKTLKGFVITLVVCSFFAAMPYCGGILSPKTAGVVTDSISAAQVISVDSSKNVIVEFKCSGVDFAECLAIFLKTNTHLELRKIDDVPGEGLSSVKAFNVLLISKDGAGRIYSAFFLR